MKGLSTFLSRNSPTILTCIGAIGTVATAVLAVKATPKAMRLLESATDEKGDELTTWETIKVAAPTYIPATLTCLGTLTCIFGANALNRKQQAALISAYVTMDQAYRQYSDKVKKSIGAEAESQIREDIAKENFTGDYISESDDTQLFYDMRHGVFFESTVDIAELDDGLECIIIDSPTLV